MCNTLWSSIYLLYSTSYLLLVVVGVGALETGTKAQYRGSSLPLTSANFEWSSFLSIFPLFCPRKQMLNWVFLNYNAPYSLNSSFSNNLYLIPFPISSPSLPFSLPYYHLVVFNLKLFPFCCYTLP